MVSRFLNWQTCELAAVLFMFTAAGEKVLETNLKQMAAW